jgi:inorganic pyrophosphatase
MQPDILFWQTLAELIENRAIIIDRPHASAHPRYPDVIYPLDYGYLAGTTASDGSGIDVWLGSLRTKTLTGILCTFDTLKSDAEIKLLIGCNPEEVQIIRKFHSKMRTLYIPNPMVDNGLSK